MPVHGLSPVREYRLVQRLLSSLRLWMYFHITVEMRPQSHNWYCQVEVCRNEYQVKVTIHFERLLSTFSSTRGTVTYATLGLIKRDLFFLK
jgi:hypothetical protein